jgi:MerR family transcriptional regulator, light-induced transcriptional regulator
MTELNETAPPPVGFGSMRPGRPGFEKGLKRHQPPLIIRGTTVSHLSRTIEAEIIPRLVMAHGNGVESVSTQAVSTHDSDVIAFAELILGPENGRAAQQVQTYRDRGIELETIYLKLLVPAARHLRHLWMNDDRDFADITLGLWRLQQLLRDFSPAFCAEAPIRSVGLRALLTPAPGEKHDIGHMMFGLVLAGEFFRRDGWDTWIEPDPADAGFLQTIRSQWFDIVEFFANGDKKLDELASNIRAIRRESPNPDLGIMVCGPVFTERPELVLLVGGDAVVPDFNQEALQARNVVNLLTDRR